MKTPAQKQKAASAALDAHEKSSGATLPKRLREFWKTNPFQYDGTVTASLKKSIPHFGPGPFGVRLTLPSWSAQSLEIGANWEDSVHYLPLFHSKDSRLFVVCLTKPQCPVFWYDEEVLNEDGVFQVASSLEGFLSLLVKAPEAFEFDETFDDEIWDKTPEKHQAPAHESSAPAAGKKVKLPDGDFLAWTTEWKGYKAVLAGDLGGSNLRLAGRGKPTEGWKKGTFTIKSDWKESPPLLDDFPTDANGLKICSERVVRILKIMKVAEIECLPVRLKDHKGNDLKASYFVINPYPALDVMDQAASGAKMNAILTTRVDQVKKIVLDTKRVPKNRRLFRMEHFSDCLIVSRSLAEAIAGGGFEGVKFESLNKPWPHA